MPGKIWNLPTKSKEELLPATACSQCEGDDACPHSPDTMVVTGGKTKTIPWCFLKVADNTHCGS